MHARTNAAWLGWLAVLLVASCGGESRAREASAPRVPPPVPWTEEFREPSVLVAARIEIRGPIGLRQHLAVRQDPARHEHRETTTAEGYRIEARQRPESDGEQIVAHLDALEIHADELLSVLEGPGERDVVVHAEGDVFFRVLRTEQETRSPSLRLIGKP